MLKTISTRELDWGFKAIPNTFFLQFLSFEIRNCVRSSSVKYAVKKILNYRFVKACIPQIKDFWGRAGPQNLEQIHCNLLPEILSRQMHQMSTSLLLYYY